MYTSVYIRRRNIRRNNSSSKIILNVWFLRSTYTLLQLTTIIFMCIDRRQHKSIIFYTFNTYINNQYNI